MQFLAAEVMTELGVDTKIPRQSSRQVHRQNFSDASNFSPMGYWKRVIYIRVVVSINGHLDFRFCEKKFSIKHLSAEQYRKDHG